MDIDAEKVRRLRAGETPIYEPGLEELLARNRERMHFDTDLGGALGPARLLFVAVGTPPTYSGDADLSAVHAVVDAIPAAENRALVMKSTVPAGTGASLLRTFAEQGKQVLSYVSCPEFLKEGTAVEDFMHPDRVVIGDQGGGPATPSPSCTPRSTPPWCAPTSPARRWSSWPPTPSWPPRSRSSTRSPTSARRPAPTWSRWRGGWAWTTASGQVPAGRHRLRRQLLPQGRRRAQAAGRQLRLPLPAAHVGDRGQRTAEAPGDRQAPAPPRLARRTPRGAARAGLQARHRRHAGGLLAGADRPLAGRRGQRQRL